MKDLCANQILIESRVNGNVVTAYYAIRLINNSQKCITNLSIEEQLDTQLQTATANVNPKCKCVVPISHSTFIIHQSQKGSELLDTSVSKLLPTEACIVYLTLEFNIGELCTSGQYREGKFNNEIVNCAVVSGMIREKCSYKCHKTDCHKCRYRLCTDRTCSDPIVIKKHEHRCSRGDTGPIGTGPTGTTGEKGGHCKAGHTGKKGDRGQRGETGPTGMKGEKGDRSGQKGETGDKGEKGFW